MLGEILEMVKRPISAVLQTQSSITIIIEFLSLLSAKKGHKATETFIRLNCECKLKESQSLKGGRPYVTKICNGMWGMMVKMNRWRWLCGNSDGFMGRFRSSPFWTNKGKAHDCSQVHSKLVLFLLNNSRFWTMVLIFQHYGFVCRPYTEKLIPKH